VACNYPPSTWPVPSGFYPGNYGANLPGNFPRGLFRFDAATLIAWGDANANWDTVLSKVWTSAPTVKEKNTAAYLMTEFDLNAITGNVGVRAVKTEVTSIFYQALTNRCAAWNPPAAPPPCNVPGAITSARGVPVLEQVVKTDHTDYLPSLNVRWDLTKGWIGRFSLSRTLGRPNYGELAGSVVLNNTLLTGTGGNPNLKPITSDNVDASIAYYMGTRAYVAAGVFNQDIKNYVKIGTAPVDLINIDTGLIATYTVTSRIGKNAKMKGFEIAGETPICRRLRHPRQRDLRRRQGRGRAADAGCLGLDVQRPRLLRGQQALGEPRVELPQRVRVFLPGQRHQHADQRSALLRRRGSLSASIGYRITKDISVHLDGNNLLNPIRYTYHVSENAPAAFYENGRQYFASVRMKF
jgi:iron complex outermembrane receptor protein